MRLLLPLLLLLYIFIPLTGYYKYKGNFVLRVTVVSDACSKQVVCTKHTYTPHHSNPHFTFSSLHFYFYVTKYNSKYNKKILFFYFLVYLTLSAFTTLRDTFRASNDSGRTTQKIHRKRNSVIVKVNSCCKNCTRLQ